MKKLILLLLGMILIFGFAGCNSSASEIELDMDEYISSPTNLVISGTQLSWDAVTNAAGYIVYANNEEVDKVKTNSYDFSSLVGDRLIFQVRTRAPRGMQDSALSASLAHVANKTQEIADINLSIQTHGYSEMLPTGFTQELVNKGMLGSEVETMLTSFDTYNASMEDAEGLMDAYALIDAFMSDINNVEALVSAFVKTVLVEALQAEIDDLEMEIILFEPVYTQVRVEEIQTQIDMLQELLDQIQNDPQAIVLTITTTIEYFMSVEAMITSDLVSNIEALASESPNTINVEELLLVKDEIVHILRDTMPTQEDMLLMYQMYNVLVSVSGATVSGDFSIENYDGKMAAQSLMTLEAFINFINGLDNAYFTAMIDELGSVKSEEMIAAELIILNIKYFDSFKEDNDDLLDEIGDIFTEEEQELVFNQSVGMVDMIEGLDEGSAAVVVDMLSNVHFQTILSLQTVLEDSFDAFLDAFVEMDGEIVRLLVVSQNFYDDYMGDTYSNYALDEEYSNYTEYQHEQTLVSYQIAKQAMYLLDAVLGTMNTEDYQTVFEFIFSLIPDEEMINDNSSGDFGMSMASYAIFLYSTIFESVVEESADEQLELLQNLVEYIVDNDVFTDLYQSEVLLYQYAVGEYGLDYKNSYDRYDEYIEDSYIENWQLIFVANLYDGFMTNGNRGLVDDIIDAVALALVAPDVQTEMGMTSAEVNTMKTNVGLLLDYISNQFDDLKDLNAANLSSSDIEDLDAFYIEIQAKIMQITADPSN